MEGYCATGQSPHWAVAPLEEEEEVSWSGCQMASTKMRLSKEQRLACLGVTGAICTTPIGAMEALTGLSQLDLVIQGEARSAAHHLWSLGCWSYLHPIQGISCI